MFRELGMRFLKGDRGHPEASKGPWSSRIFYQTVRRGLRTVDADVVTDGGKAHVWDRNPVLKKKPGFE